MRKLLLFPFCVLLFLADRETGAQEGCTVPNISGLPATIQFVAGTNEPYTDFQAVRLALGLPDEDGQVEEGGWINSCDSLPSFIVGGGLTDGADVWPMRVIPENEMFYRGGACAEVHMGELRINRDAAGHCVSNWTYVLRHEIGHVLRLRDTDDHHVCAKKRQSRQHHVPRSGPWRTSHHRPRLCSR